MKGVDIIGKQKKVKRPPKIVHYAKARKFTKQPSTKGSQKNQDLSLEDRIHFKNIDASSS